MKLNELSSPKGARSKSKRVGRGGKWGKTCCRGANGQNSRSGGGKGPGFEGGQTPWFLRLPKFRGFKNPFREEYQIVNLRDLERLDDINEVNPMVLYENNMIKDPDKPVKILANGAIDKALTIRATKFSKGAKKAIEEAGGKAEVV